MAQDEVHKLKQLIQAAADDKHMPEADLIVLDDQKLGLLAQNDLITPVILCDTTEEQFAQVVGTLGAAKVLKMLFPDKGQAGSAQPMTVPPDVVAARARTASRYVNFMLGDDGKPHAVVTLDQRRLITYGHGGHGQLREGSTVQVYLNNPEDDKPAPAKATVKFIKTQLDLVILEVDRELDPPPLDADVHPGEPYIMLAYSTTSASSHQEFGKPLPEDHASVSHGSIATSVPDKNGCIRGDTRPSPGDSGGGVFSLETGKLLGMCIGREKIKGRDGQYKDGFKSVLVPVAGVLMLLS